MLGPQNRFVVARNWNNICWSLVQWPVCKLPKPPLQHFSFIPKKKKKRNPGTLLGSWSSVPIIISSIPASLPFCHTYLEKSKPQINLAVYLPLVHIQTDKYYWNKNYTISWICPIKCMVSTSMGFQCQKTIFHLSPSSPIPTRTISNSFYFLQPFSSLISNSNLNIRFYKELEKPSPVCSASTLCFSSFSPIIIARCPTFCLKLSFLLDFESWSILTNQRSLPISSFHS